MSKIIEEYNKQVELGMIDNPLSWHVWKKAWELSNINNMKQKVIDWAKERGLIKEDNAPKQIIKLSEEVGELCSAYLKQNDLELYDAIGDIQVVLIILCEQLDIDYDKALESAYNVIKNRKGKTVNGTFIKEVN